MNRSIILACAGLTAAGILCAPHVASANYVYDTDVTPEVIFGSGVTNGGWTVFRDADRGLELGLRAKLRYDLNGNPQNTFPFAGVGSQGQGVYTFNPADGNAPVNNTIWNFEFAINSNYNDNGANLNSFTYRLDYENVGTGNTSGQNPFAILTLNPITSTFGDNNTENGGGTTAVGFALTGALSNNNVAQASLNPGFSNVAFANFDPQGIGDVYRITLTALQSGAAIGSVMIDVNQVPLPPAVIMVLTALAGLYGLRFLPGAREKAAPAAA